MGVSRNMLFVFFMIMLSASFVYAQSKDPGGAAPTEIITQKLPNGYTLGFEDNKEKTRILEYVKDGETVQNWSELLTTQMFKALNVEPVKYLEVVAGNWSKACPGVSLGKVKLSEVNGYKAASVFFKCPSNPATGKPETTLFKAVRGESTFYVFQKAFRFIPTLEQAVDAEKYINTILLCNGSEEHPC